MDDSTFLTLREPATSLRMRWRPFWRWWVQTSTVGSSPRVFSRAVDSCASRSQKTPSVESHRPEGERVWRDGGNPHHRPLSLISSLGAGAQTRRRRRVALSRPPRSVPRGPGGGTLWESGCTTELEHRARDSDRRCLAKKIVRDLQNPRAADPASIWAAGDRVLMAAIESARERNREGGRASY